MRGPYSVRVAGWLRQKSRRDLGLPAALVLATVALAVTSVLTVRQEGPRRMRIAIETHRAVSAVLAGRMDESVRRLAVGVQSAIEQEQRRRGTLLSALRALEQAHPWAGPLVVVGREAASAVTLPTHTAVASWAAAEREEHQLNRPQRAAILYARVALDAATPDERLEALNGQARSELKAGRIAQARGLYEQIASLADGLDGAQLKWGVIAHAQRLECERLAGGKETGEAALRLLQFVTERRFIMDADVFRYYRGLAEQALSVHPSSGSDAAQRLARRNQQLDQLDQTIRASGVALSGGRPEDPHSNAVVIPLPAQGTGRVEAGVVYLPEEANVATLLAGVVSEQGPWSEMGVALVDRDGRSLASAPQADPEDVAATSVALRALPGWSVATLPRAGSFATSASSETARYGRWLALVFVTVVVAFVLAARSIRRELRLARLRADFVASVSHELRTPLALIRMFGESLREGWVDDRQKKEYYEVITRESERLTALIDNVLDFSRMEAGLRKYQLAVLDLRMLLAKLLDRYEFHLQAARIDLIRRLPDGPLHARVDHEAIEQVIVNLLSNAVKYMGAPERPNRQVAVALTQENTQIVLRVSDTGIGISEADRVHIFERFYRAENDAVRAVAGSGLGLTLARAHIVAHGGSIHVESALGQGSTFVVSLPMVSMLGDV